MRTPRLTALFLLPLLLGCTDSLGIIGGDCSAEKSRLRREMGPPDRSSGRGGGPGDSNIEEWYYFEGGATRVYTFRWGGPYPECEVNGPVLRALLPL